MMNRTIAELVNEYYNDLQEAFKTGHLNLNRLHFSSDVVFLRPSERVEGKHMVEQMMQEHFVPPIKRLEIVHQFFDKTSCCTIIDCVSKNSVTVPMAEWLKFKDGKIYEVHQFFDPALGSKAWEQLKKHTA